MQPQRPGPSEPHRPGGAEGEHADLARTVADIHDHLRRIEGRRGKGQGVAVWEQPSKGETRWPVTIAIGCAIALQTALPHHLDIGPVWLLPVLEGACGAVLLVINPRRIGTGTRDLRWLGITLIAMLSLANGWSSGELIRDILEGHAGKTAGPLFADGAAIYVTNVIAFSLWYWESDRGGPGARARGGARFPELLFPQMTQGDISPHDWHPTYLDYLYTSYTNATAFSPTDVMPLTRWAKVLFLFQSAVALSVGALVVARAVNILS